MTEAKPAILVVEDNILQARSLQRLLEWSGFSVIGIAKSNSEAMDYLKKMRPDAVTLDYSLKDGVSTSIGEYLNDNAIPFVFVTGQAASIRKLSKLRDVRVIHKPYLDEDIVDSLKDLLAS